MGYILRSFKEFKETGILDVASFDSKDWSRFDQLCKDHNVKYQFQISTSRIKRTN